MATVEFARTVMRDLRNRFSYEEVENLVRDATSNTNEPPTPYHIRQIAQCMEHADAYPKAFHMLWRRLCHLEYKRHVVKALLVLDALVRIKPPSKTVQLKLMVDIRERWPEIYRLAKLRPSSSSETIAQIQRVAERLCAFILGYESGYARPQEIEEDDEEEEDEEEEGKPKKRRRRKKRTTKTEIIEEQGVADVSPSEPSMSRHRELDPFGFDSFAQADLEWKPAPSSAEPSMSQQVSPQQVRWSCNECTFLNPPDAQQCEMCGKQRMDCEEEQKEVIGWVCNTCSLVNKPSAMVCEVCECRRGTSYAENSGASTGFGSEGETSSIGEGEEEREGVEGEEGEGEEGESVPGEVRVSRIGSTVPGSWSCSWCSFSNSPSADFCDVCHKEGKYSRQAQQVKLQFAQRQERAAGEQSWSCPKCTRINPATRVECSSCHTQSPVIASKIAEQRLLKGPGYDQEHGSGSSPSSVPESPVDSPRKGSSSSSASLAISNLPLAASADPSAFRPIPPLSNIPAPNSSRPLGFAQGMADSSSKRSESNAITSPAGIDLLAVVGAGARDAAEQRAALDHYNQQKEKYLETYGWPCSACTILNDPHAMKCEVCDTAKPVQLKTRRKRETFPSSPVDLSLGVIGVNARASDKASSSNRSSLPLSDATAATPPKNQWPCQICTFLNDEALETCSMCTAPKPASFQSASSLPQLVKRDSVSISAPSSMHSLTILDALASGTEKGPVPAPGLKKYPAQFQLQEQQQLFAAEQARQYNQAQFQMQVQQRMQTDAQLRLQAQAQLASLPPLTNIAQRASLNQSEAWLNEHHELKQRQDQAAVAAAPAARSSGNLGELINDFFPSVSSDAPVSLPKQASVDNFSVQNQVQPRSVSASSANTITKPSLQPLQQSPNIASRSPGISPTAEFDSLFESSAIGFASDLIHFNDSSCLSGHPVVLPISKSAESSLHSLYARDQKSSFLSEPPVEKHRTRRDRSPGARISPTVSSDVLSHQEASSRSSTPVPTEEGGISHEDQFQKAFQTSGESLASNQEHIFSNNPFDEEEGAFDEIMPGETPAEYNHPHVNDLATSFARNLDVADQPSSVIKHSTASSSNVSALSSVAARPAPLPVKFPTSKPKKSSKTDAIFKESSTPKPLVVKESADPHAPVRISPQSQSTSTSSPSSNAHMTDVEKRERVRAEILASEKSYVQGLNDLIQHFMEPIKKAGPKIGVEPRHVAAIFGNLTVLAQFHSIFLDDLQSNSNTSDVFLKFADFLKMYSQYIAGYEKSIATINSLRDNKAFTRLIEDKRSELNGRGIMHYLIMPVQRVPRYGLLLEALSKYTPSDHPEREMLTKAHKKIDSIAEFINENKRQIENMSRLLDIQNRLKTHDLDLSLPSHRLIQEGVFLPNRRLIKEGLLRKINPESIDNYQSAMSYGSEQINPSNNAEASDALMFLFNDMLLWTNKEFEMIDNILLTSVTFEPDSAALRRVPFVLALGVRGEHFRSNMVFACKDETERDEWSRYILSSISNACDSQKTRVLKRKTSSARSEGLISATKAVSSPFVEVQGMNNNFLKQMFSKAHPPPSRTEPPRPPLQSNSSASSTTSSLFNSSADIFDVEPPSGTTPSYVLPPTSQTIGTPLNGCTSSTSSSQSDLGSSLLSQNGAQATHLPSSVTSSLVPPLLLSQVSSSVPSTQISKPPPLLSTITGSASHTSFSSTASNQTGVDSTVFASSKPFSSTDLAQLTGTNANYALASAASPSPPPSSLSPTPSPSPPNALPSPPAGTSTTNEPAVSAKRASSHSNYNL